MRAKAFTFKRTIKRTKTFHGLSIDLTVADAKELRRALRYNLDSPFLDNVYEALDAFLNGIPGSAESPK